IIVGEDGMNRIWGHGRTIHDGFTSLEAIQVSPVQALHPRNSFGANKTNLTYDFQSVLDQVSRSAPESAPALAAFYNDPFTDPEPLKILSPTYFPGSEELIRKHRPR